MANSSKVRWFRSIVILEIPVDIIIVKRERSLYYSTQAEPNHGVLCNTSNRRSENSWQTFNKRSYLDHRFLGDRYTSTTPCSIHSFLPLSCEALDDTFVFTMLTHSVGTEPISQTKAHHRLMSMSSVGKTLHCKVF